MPEVGDSCTRCQKVSPAENGYKRAKHTPVHVSKHNAAKLWISGSLLCQGGVCSHQYKIFAHGESAVWIAVKLLILLFLAKLHPGTFPVQSSVLSPSAFSSWVSSSTPTMTRTAVSFSPHRIGWWEGLPSGLTAIQVKEFTLRRGTSVIA